MPTPLVEQPSAAPTRKVQAGAITGGVTALAGAPVVVAWLWEMFSDKPMDAGVAVALGGVLTWLVQTVTSYWVKNRATDLGE